MARYIQLNRIWRLEESLNEADPLRVGRSSVPTISIPSGSSPLQPSYSTPEGWLYDLQGTAPGCFLRLDLPDYDKRVTVYRESSLWEPERRKRPSNRRPHQTRVVIELPGARELDYLLLPYDGSPVRLVFAGMPVWPLKTVVESYYERPDRPDKEPKLLNRFVFLNEPPYYDPNAILILYDRLYALDTNTHDHPSGRKLSISSLCVGRAAPTSHGYSLQVEITGALKLDVQGRPEIEGWRALFRRLLHESDRRQGRTGIIVDSELGYIIQYDHRGGPFDFIYASADSGGNQFGVNQMISLCHSYCKTIRSVADTKSIPEIEAEIRRAKVGDLLKTAHSKLDT
jgi:hypothetical protein